jgi:hypothetical protein
MAKSIFLFICCALLFRSLRAQVLRFDTVFLQKLQFTQKLQFKKADLNWLVSTDRLTYYFAKKSADTNSDSGRSMLYLGPARKDTVDLGLPAVKHRKTDIQIRSGQP